MDWNHITAQAMFVVETLWITLSSPRALRLYVVAMAIAAVALALLRARSRKDFLEGVTEDYFAVRIPGRAPTRHASIRRRETLVRTTQQQRARGVWLAIAELFALGVLFPTALLALGTIHYAWFDPGVAALVDDRSTVPILDPAMWQIGGYIADHLLRGGLFDLMEVFKLHASSVSNNRDAYGYTIGLFLFHLYVEAFFLFGLIALGKMALVVPRAMRTTPSPLPA